MIFTCDFVARENNWQIASLVNQKLLFTVTHALFFTSCICVSKHDSNLTIIGRRQVII